MWRPLDPLDEHRTADEPYALPIGPDRRGAEAPGERNEIEQPIVSLARLREQMRGEEPERVPLVRPVVGQRSEVQP